MCRELPIFNAICPRLRCLRLRTQENKLIRATELYKNWEY